MQLYADTTGRRGAQAAADALVVVWIVVWVRVASWLHGLVQRLADPGEVLESAGLGLTDRALDAAETVAGVPAVGDDLRRPLDVIAEAGRDIAGAGVRQQEVVGSLATGLAAVVVVGAVLAVLALWLPWRLRWVLQVREVARALAASPEPSLLALRALTNRPLRELRGIDPDPAGAWRAGDPVVVRRLAELELAALGLRAGTGPGGGETSGGATSGGAGVT